MKLIKALRAVLLVLTLSTRCRAESDGPPKDRYLSLPKLDKCNSRYKEFQYKDRNYFYSGHNPELKDKKFDWLDARNTCRDYCMETVSFETQDKFDFIKAYIEQNNISFVWTSGRICDFEGCEGRWDLLPKRIKGWLWSANQIPIFPTNQTPPGWKYQPWSFTGIKKKPQPDNAEFYLSQTSEACLGVLNNMYNDSVAWHDIACYHRARFICEDSELLLKEVHEKKDEDENVSDDIESTSVGTTKAAETTTKSAVVNARQRNPNAEKDSLRQTKRRKVLVKKVKTESEENGKNAETVAEHIDANNSNTTVREENQSEDKAAFAKVEAADSKDETSESLSAKDEALGEDKTDEEVETTTETEAPSTTTETEAPSTTTTESTTTRPRFRGQLRRRTQ